MVQLSLPKNSTATEGKVFIAASGATRVKTFRVYRWSPDDDSNPRIDTYEVDLDTCGPKGLDALIRSRTRSTRPWRSGGHAARGSVDPAPCTSTEPIRSLAPRASMTS